MILDDVKAYLAEQGITQTMGRDFLPDSPDEAIGLFLYSSVPDSYGCVTHYVQAQVRASEGDRDAAKALACQMYPLVESGPEDEVLQIGERWAVVHVRTRPKMLRVDESGRPIYYFEFSLMGEDKP